MIQLIKGLRPANPLFMLTAFGVGVVWVWLRPSSKGPRRYLLAVTLAYCFLSLPLGAGILLAGLSTGMPRVESREAARGADAVVVLGGGARTVSVGGLVAVELRGDSRVRAMEGARVFKLIGARLLVASGGRPERGQIIRPESEALRDALIALGVPATAIVEESESKTTWDQARLVGPVLRAHGAGRFVLVTSPMHMRRAMAVFRAVGLDPVPSVSPMRPENDPSPPLLLPDADSLALSDQAIYEYAATAYYWWSGWLRAPSR